MPSKSNRQNHAKCDKIGSAAAKAGRPEWETINTNFTFPEEPIVLNGAGKTKNEESVVRKKESVFSRISRLIRGKEKA